MKINSSVTVSRKKNEKSKIAEDFGSKLTSTNKAEDYNKKVIMSGTAMRKTLGNHKSGRIDEVIKTGTTRFLTWQTPFRRPQGKNLTAKKKLLNRSYEILLDCIKPYKEVVIERKTQIIQTNQIIKRFSKDEVTVEKKATRKVHFFTISEKIQMPNCSAIEQTDIDEMTDLKLDNCNIEKSDTKDEQQEDADPGPKSKRFKTTMSSEDFINSALSKI